MSKMSHYGYTTETFALVYALFDAVQKTRHRVKKKCLNPSLILHHIKHYMHFLNIFR